MEWLLGVIGIGAIALYLVGNNFGMPEKRSEEDPFIHQDNDETFQSLNTESSSLNTESSSLFDDESINNPSSIFDDDLDFCNGMSINPASGLPMMGCVDIEGNPYGTDFSHDFDDSWSISSSDSIFDDHWTSSSSLNDD